jgi:type IV pilus assembly protein PilQ
MRRAWLIALLFPLQLAAQQGGAPIRVTGLRLLPAGGATEIVIETAGGAPAWRDFALENPSRMVVDVENARADLPAARFEALNRGGVAAIRASQFSPSVVRIAVDLDRAAQYTVTQERDGLHVRLATGAGVFPTWSSAATAAPPRPGQPAQAVQQPQQQQQPRITVTFQDADIRDVLATFAEFTGRSIVPGAQVTGNVSATITDQPWDLALETILRAYGLAAEEMPSGIIRVDQVANLQTRQTQEPLVTRAFRINYVPVAELVTTLTPLISERGAVSPNPSTNTLIVTDVASVVESIAGLLGQLDIRTPQVSIQAKLIFVNRTNAEELGITYDLKDSRGNSLNRLVDVPDPRNPGQTTSEDLVLLGGNSVAALGNANVRVQGPQLETVLSLVLGRYTLVSFIDALQSAELSDVQASPTITMLDNVEGEIRVGERTPIRVVDLGAGVAGGGAEGGGVSLPRASAQLVETGIILRVTPHVTGDGRVLMTLHAERSSAQAAATDIGVIFQEQVGRTRLMVADGETAVIGGLTVTEVTDVRAGIPFLMDLPVVGRLFRTDRQREQKRDLLIMVTPHIVNTSAEG